MHRDVVELMINSEEHADSVLFRNDSPLANHGNGQSLDRNTVATGSGFSPAYICRLWYEVVKERLLNMNWKEQYLMMLGSNCCYKYSICNFSLAIFAIFFFPVLLATSQSEIGGLQRMSPSQKAESMGAVIFCISIYAVTLLITSYVLVRRYYMEKQQVKQSVHQIFFDLKKMRKEKPNGLARQVYNALKISESRTMEDALEMSRKNVDVDNDPSSLLNKKPQKDMNINVSPANDNFAYVLKNPNDKDISPYSPDTSCNSDIWDHSIAENIGDITFDPADYGKFNGNAMIVRAESLIDQHRTRLLVSEITDRWRVSI